MRFGELFRLALRSLRRQKSRTLLTTLGVAVGACSLAFSISLGVGLRELIDREFRERPGFWEVRVMPGAMPPPVPESEIPAERIKVEGDFDEARQQRLKRQLVQRYQQNLRTKPPAMLTDASIAELATLPDVQGIITARFAQGWGYWNGASAFVNVVGGRSDQPQLKERILAGRLPREGECVISEMLLYDLGARSDAQVQASLGTPITVELGSHRDEQLPTLLEKLPFTAAEKQTIREVLTRSTGEPVKPPTGTFTIVGIVRTPLPRDDEERGSFQYRWTTLYTNGPQSEALFRQQPHLRDGHYEQAEVKVRPGGDLKQTVDAIEAKGFITASAAAWFSSAKREVTLIGVGLNVFAIVALLVAALGITNTFVTSVIERTREIGILKALGATGKQVRRLFLIEGTLIGLAGGIVGLLLARLLAGPADEFVKHQVQALMQGRPMMTASIFNFPLWLTLATPLFAAAVTTLAAIYPAHRAAKIAPIEALRYG